MAAIYLIRNIVNGKEYVGKAHVPRVRWNRHRRYLNTGTHSNSHLQRSWNAFGECKFIFEILEHVDLRDKATDLGGYIVDCEYLKEREKWWIDLLGVRDPNRGYNKCDPLYGPIGTFSSVETRQKIAASLKGKPKSLVHRENMSAARVGNTNSVGRIQSKETRDKISAALKGRAPTMLGRHHSPESREKMSASRMGNQNARKRKV